MSFLDDTTVMGALFPNAADSGMPYLQQAGNQMPGYYQPYIDAGMGQLPNLQREYGQMTNNPGAFINNMGKNFQQSPGYNFQVGQATNAANHAAAAGGYVGGPQEQQSLGSTVSGLANEDYYNWLKQVMGAYGAGVQGQQGLYKTGFDASDDLASNLSAILQSQAQLAYTGQANQNQMLQGMIGAGIGAAAGA